jgi:hypothetical protein
MAATTALNLNVGITSDTQVGGRGSSEQRGFDTTLTLISRLEATTLSMIDPIQIHARVWEWETDTLRTPKLNVNSGFQYFTANGGQNPTQRTVRNNYSQVFIGPVETEGTLRREETNTGDEHEYQVEEKEAVALGRDINLSLLAVNGAKGITAGGVSNRVMGGFFSYGQQNIVNSAAGAVTQNTVAYAQAANGGAVVPTLTSTGSLVPVNDGTTVFAGGTPYAWTRKVFDKTLANVFDQGGAPTNVIVSPGLRAVLSEEIGRQGSNDIYRINMSSPEEIINTTTVYITDFGFRLRIDTEQMLKTSYGSDSKSLIAFNPKNIKMGYITPVTRNDDIPQPIYGAASALVAEGTAVFYNPADILIMRNMIDDITDAAYV